MLTRIIAALALVPLFIFIIIGGIPLYIAEMAILAIALREFYKAFNAKDILDCEREANLVRKTMGMYHRRQTKIVYTTDNIDLQPKISIVEWKSLCVQS